MKKIKALIVIGENEVINVEKVNQQLQNVYETYEDRRKSLIALNANPIDFNNISSRFDFSSIVFDETKVKSSFSEDKTKEYVEYDGKAIGYLQIIIEPNYETKFGFGKTSFTLI